jgi:hypothetical protein
VWIQNAYGKIVHVCRDDDAFPAAVVSLGLLGPIVRVRIQCFAPSFNRRNTGTEMRTYCGAELTDIVPTTTTGFRYAMYKKKMIRYDETDTIEEPTPPACGGCLDTLAAAACPIYTLDEIIGCVPSLAYLTGQILAKPGSTVADKTEVFNPVPVAPNFVIEYAIPVACAAACFDELTVRAAHC